MNKELLEIIGAIIGVALTIGAIITAIVYFYVTFKAAKMSGSTKIATDAMSNLQITVTALKVQNELWEGQIAAVTKKNMEQGESIKELTGKVDTLSTIPLAKIEQHMSDTNKILQSLLPLLPLTSTERTVINKTTVKK